MYGAQLVDIVSITYYQFPARFVYGGETREINVFPRPVIICSGSGF
jgi:hypothetical protein